MNKKFLSAILFGALMVASTGTFVSCKDYDDEIDDLQEQINKLATKEDMTSQIASLQSALTAAQSEAAAAKTSAEDAVAKATSAESAATEAEKAAAQAALDAANAKVEAIEAAQEEVAKVQAELEAAIDSKFEAAKDEFAETIAELTKKVEELTGYTTGMVTGISFAVADNTVETDENGEIVYDGKETLDPNLDVNYARVKAINMPKDLKQYTDASVTAGTYLAQVLADPVSSYEFGKGMSGAFTIKAGDVNTVTDYMLVNVDPVNAAVSSDMLSLINGYGENLNDYVNITCATWGGEIHRTRSAANTGLRKVGVQLKNDVDFEAFDKLVLSDEGSTHSSTGCADTHTYISYALAATDSKSRTVTSSFDVTLHVQEEKEAIDIEKRTTIYSEAGERSKAIADFQKGGDAASVDEGCYPIESGESFRITVNSNGGRVMASYVIVDKNFAGLSVTDKAALNTLDVKGTDAVITGSTHTITISGTPGILVPLKLVTVDYLGNVKVNMIWVKASEAVSATVAYTITPKAVVSTPTTWTVNTGELQEFTIPTNASKFSVSLLAGEDVHGSSPATFNTGTTNGTVDKSELKIGTSNFLKLYKNTSKASAANLGEVAYAEFVGTLNLQAMREGTTYQGTIKFYDATGSHLKTTAIKLTKVLPTAVPANFSAKTNAINNGILTIYPEPQTDGKGVFTLDKAFNNWNLPDYDLVITGITDSNPVKGTYDESAYSIKDIDANVIEPVKDNEDATAYETTVSYDYGDIRFHPEGHGVDDNIERCIVPWTAFSTKFGCMITDSEYKWINTPKVYYREDIELDGTIYDADGNPTYQDVILVTDTYGKEINPFSNVAANGWSTWAEALNTGANKSTSSRPVIKLITNGDRVNEFFTADYGVANGKTTIKLTKTSTEVVLSGDVETTVVLVIKDKFGHEHEVDALTFTMKKDHSGDAK